MVHRTSKIIADFLIIVNILASCSFYPNNNSSKISAEEIATEEITTEKIEETTLVLSCFRGIPNYISNAVEIFNSEDNGYNITVQDYSQFIGEMPSEGEENAEEKINKAYAQAYQKFYDDCISGTEIDIIYNDNQMPYMDKLASSGAFVDLYEFPDSIFAEMNSNIISESEMDGQLFEMPLSFTINTLIGMEQYSKKNWSIDDFINCCNSLPDDVLLCNPEYRTGVYDMLVTYNMMSFFSVDNKVGFNSDEYRKAVNFCLNFSNDSIYIENSDYDKFFLQDLYIHNFGSFHSSIEDFEAQNGKAVITGFPSDNGNNISINIRDTLSVCSKSSFEKQEGAWNFLKSAVSDEQQCKITDNFPVNSNSFDKISEQQISKGFLTEKEKAELDNMIADGKVKKRYISDINKLIGTDETNLLFEFQSVDETIKNIHEKIYTFKEN